MSSIASVFGREILDSRGNPTVEVEVTLESGLRARAAVPSGASTGSREALEMRDGDKARYCGKGVTKAVDHVNGEIADALLGMDVLRQVQVDNTLIDLDGTDNKSRLGANAMLGVSMACARVAASFVGLPLFKYLGGINAKVLPAPMMNIINGGAHAPNNLDIQEFMIMPVGAMTFRDSLRIGTEIFHTLQGILKKDGHVTSVGDEGGFAPNLKNHDEAFGYIIKAIEEAGYNPGSEVVLAIDAAASEFHKNGKYMIGEKGALSSPEMIEWLAEFTAKYPLISIEDGLAEDDWDGWAALTAALGKRCIRMQFLCRRKKQVFPRDGRKIVFLFFAQVKNLVNDGSCQQDEGKNPIEEGCRRCNGKNGNDEKGRFLIGFILIDEGLDDFLRFSFCHDLVP